MDHKAALIGGAGFVGRNIYKLLKSARVDVLVIDSLRGMHNGRLPADIDPADVLAKSCEDVMPDDLRGVDTVVHLASKQDYRPDHAEYVRNNVGELATLFTRGLGDAERFILFSSQTVYGTSPLPYEVGTHLLQPTEQYGLSKLMQERWAQVFCPVPCYVLRPTIIVGPGQNGKNLYAGLIKNTVARIAAGMHPMIYGDGEQQRCYVSVHDIGRYVLGIALSSQKPSVINATSREGALTVNEVVGRIIGIMGASVEPIRNEYLRVADQRQLHCISQCDMPDLFGPAATGKPLEEYVESLLQTGLPVAEEIRAVDAQNLRDGVIVPVEGK